MQNTWTRPEYLECQEYPQADPYNWIRIRILLFNFDESADLVPDQNNFLPEYSCVFKGLGWFYFWEEYLGGKSHDTFTLKQDF